MGDSSEIIPRSSPTQIAGDAVVSHGPSENILSCEATTFSRRNDQLCNTFLFLFSCFVLPYSPLLLPRIAFFNKVLAYISALGSDF